VWQARSHSSPLGGPHLWQAMAYVERNPVRAHLAACAEEYAWSSAGLRLWGAADLVDLTPWKAKYDWARWQAALRSKHRRSRHGRPLGDEQFVENLEKRCGRRLRAQPVGPPKKSSEDEGNQLSLGYGV